MRESAHWQIAGLACETGIAPQLLIEAGDEMIAAMYDYLAWRAEKMKRK